MFDGTNLTIISDVDQDMKAVYLTPIKSQTKNRAQFGAHIRS